MKLSDLVCVHQRTKSRVRAIIHSLDLARGYHFMYQHDKNVKLLNKIGLNQNNETKYLHNYFIM